MSTQDSVGFANLLRVLKGSPISRDLPKTPETLEDS